MLKIYNVHILEIHSEVYKKIIYVSYCICQKTPCRTFKTPCSKIYSYKSTTETGHAPICTMQLLGDQLLWGLCPIVLCTKYKYLSYLTKCWSHPCRSDLRAFRGCGCSGVVQLSVEWCANLLLLGSTGWSLVRRPVRAGGGYSGTKTRHWGARGHGKTKEQIGAGQKLQSIK